MHLHIINSGFYYIIITFCNRFVSFLHFSSSLESNILEASVEMINGNSDWLQGANSGGSSGCLAWGPIQKEHDQIHQKRNLEKLMRSVTWMAAFGKGRFIFQQAQYKLLYVTCSLKFGPSGYHALNHMTSACKCSPVTSVDLDNFSMTHKVMPHRNWHQVWLVFVMETLQLLLY